MNVFETIYILVYTSTPNTRSHHPPRPHETAEAHLYRPSTTHNHSHITLPIHRRVTQSKHNVHDFHFQYTMLYQDINHRPPSIKALPVNHVVEKSIYIYRYER